MSNGEGFSVEGYIRQVEMAYLRILRQNSPWLEYLRASTYQSDRVMLLILPLVRVPPYERTVVQDVLLRELVRHLCQLCDDREVILIEIENEIRDITMHDDKIEQNEIIENFVSQFVSDDSD